MNFFKKLKFWRRRSDGAVSQERSEELRENLEEQDANTEQVLRSCIAELQEVLKERDREGATFRDTITGLEKQLEETKFLKNETEANLFGLEEKLKAKDREKEQMESNFLGISFGYQKEMEEITRSGYETMTKLGKRYNEIVKENDQMESTLRATIVKLEKELEETKCLKNEAEAKMCGLEKKLKEKDSKRYKMKAAYSDKITGLKKKLKEKVSERDQVIRTLRGQIEEEREANLTAEAILCSEKREMERVMKETERYCSKVETMLCGKICQTEELERKLQKRMCFQEKMHDWKNVEKALRGQIKQLKERVSLLESDKEKMIDILSCHIKAQTDAQQQTDGMCQVNIILNIQIKELDEKLQEQMNIHREEKCDWKNAEKALHGQIKQLKNTIAVMENDKQNSDRTLFQRKRHCPAKRSTDFLWN
jgi:chromosome segregation ATPase